MESRDQRSAVEYLVVTLRKITRIVQLIPFAYLLLLTAYLFVEPCLSENLLSTADNVLCVPLYSVFAFLFVGKLLRLCVWFKTACLLPIAIKASEYIDSYIITFTQEEVVIINVLFAVAFLSFLVQAYIHFFIRK